jgi:hypothetical protein
LSAFFSDFGLPGQNVIVLCADRETHPAPEANSSVA